ncbi:YlcI/YnfO family protein [Enteroscipio rubneri]|mgnify:CR=1 FL=1|uniref:YlcI/YnfO family protein n=1 Tax=Enteroscipio rubneri TaxID=2070686 RepID=UPI003207EF36
MDYAEMLRDGASQTEMREYLVDGDTVAVTIRIPRNLRDSAKKAAALRGTNFSAFIRECMIDELIRERQ